MLRALELAEKAKGYAAPNPMVGAVLVYEGRVIGEGYHRQYRQAHAEVNCLERVLPEDKQYIPESTMYVSLEPCAHWGKTPPCANRLVAEGVKKVVIANGDPFKEVSGRGIQLLKDAGIDVELGLLEKEGRWLNRRFFHFHEAKRPYVILKWAQSANGFMAPVDGSRLQLSNELSQRLVHRWRTEEAAIMVGYNTALADDPQLTARLWDGPQPLRIVLDRALQLPRTHSLFDGKVPTWVLNEKTMGQEENLNFQQLASGEQLLPQLMQLLYDAGKQSLIVEGGAALLKSFINAGLWDEARVFHTPVTMGDGIAAPLLTHSNMVYATAVGTDQLQLLQHVNNHFSYRQGMSL